MALESEFVIKQGEYDLTHAAMKLRGQRLLYAGDDYQFNFTYVDANGDPIDISGATLTMMAKYDVNDADGGAIFTGSGTVTDGPAGKFNFRLDDTDVIGPQYILGYYAIQMTIGDVTETIISGNIEFLPNVIQATP